MERLLANTKFTAPGRSLLLSLLLLAGSASAGVQIIDGSGTAVFTDQSSINNSLVASGNAVSIGLKGQSTAHVQVTANTTTLQFEGSVDGANFFSVNAVADGTGAIVTSTTGTGSWTIDTAALATVRVRQSAAGAATVSMVVSQGEAAVALSQPIPAGTNIIGALSANQSENINQVGGAAVVTAASGQLKVGITGNAAGALDAANNASAPANVLVGGAQLQSGAAATNGTAGQVGSVLAGLDHVLYSRMGGPVVFSCFKEAITATTECQAASGAGLKNYVTSVSCSNEAATVQTVDVIFGTGINCGTGTTALTHKFQMGTVATTTSPLWISQTFLTPLNPTAANAICVRPANATAFGCTITGFIAP